MGEVKAVLKGYMRAAVKAKDVLERKVRATEGEVRAA